MRIVSLLLTLALLVLPALNARAAESEKFAIYYADSLSPDHFRAYHLVVLDSTRHVPLPPLKEEGKTLLGYLALGEVSQTNPAYATLKSHNLVLQENPNWKGSYFVDLRDPVWAKMVLEEIIPGILRQGFYGLFIDTLDSSIALEKSDPGKYAGMTEAAVHLIAAIRMNYPTVKIMMNRAYGILPKVASSLDMELGESVYSSYSADKKTYHKVEDVAYRDQVAALQEAQHTNSNLKVYTLDYADPSDRIDVKDIYRIERANGFIPYVATAGLDRLVDEPSSE